MNKTKRVALKKRRARARKYDEKRKQTTATEATARR